jgi:ribosome biogenesis GTPase
MSNSDNEFLSRQGWDVFFEQVFKDPFLSALTPARVIGEERELYRVQCGENETCWASIAGKMQHRARGRQDFPAVGDWVLMDLPAGSERGVIHGICPRKSVIQRRQVGSSTGDAQIIAANVDTVFIATSMNEDFYIRRLHRYVTVVMETKAAPVILLTKADLQSDGGTSLKAEVQREFPGVDVQVLSMNDFAAADFFKTYLRQGKTVVVMGSSGVGKSTLVNFLIGDTKIKTQEVREYDGRGRHTTTSRFLLPTRFEGWIIDTPGMRELSLLDHEDGLNTQFADIDQYLGRCRFTDCAHNEEPGCAIQAALDQGLIREDRWVSYQKLAAEIRHALRKQDKVLYAEDRKRWKKQSLAGRALGAHKRGIK